MDGYQSRLHLFVNLFIILLLYLLPSKIAYDSVANHIFPLQFHMMIPPLTTTRACDGNADQSPRRNSYCASRGGCSGCGMTSRRGRLHRALVSACISVFEKAKIPLITLISQADNKLSLLSQNNPTKLSISMGIGLAVLSYSKFSFLEAEKERVKNGKMTL